MGKRDGRVCMVYLHGNGRHEPGVVRALVRPHRLTNLPTAKGSAVGARYKGVWLPFLMRTDHDQINAVPAADSLLGCAG